MTIKMRPQEEGTALIFVLLMALIFSLLLSSLLETSLLETKMSTYYQQQLTNLYDTEQLLLDDETSIAQNIIPKNATVIVPATSSNLCGVTYYRVTVQHTHNATATQLESTFAKIGDISKCTVPPAVHEGRQSWR